MTNDASDSETIDVTRSTGKDESTGMYGRPDRTLHPSHDGRGIELGGNASGGPAELARGEVAEVGSEPPINPSPVLHGEGRRLGGDHGGRPLADVAGGQGPHRLGELLHERAGKAELTVASMG